MKTKKNKIEYEMGKISDINYDGRYNKIDAMLGRDKIGTPLITLYGENSGGNQRVIRKELITLHIKEALELKATIDILMVDYLENRMDDEEDRFSNWTIKKKVEK